MLNATTCPSCRQTMPRRLLSMNSHVLRSRGERDLLIAQLTEEKTMLLRKLNAVQSPAIPLPNETLSSIFEFACQPPEFSERHTFHYYNEDDIPDPLECQYFQFTLGAVSSRWRQVVQSTPFLWAWIALDITTENVEKKAKFLQIFIENSKKVPFILALQFSEDIDPSYSFLVHQTIDNLLIETLPRIKELHLVNPPRQWHYYTPYLPHLRDCSLNLSRPANFVPDDRVMLPLNAPLRRFSLQDGRWPSNTNILLPWTTITSLHLSNIPLDLSVQVFIRCPNLVQFHYTSPLKREPPPGQVTLSTPISFQHLVDFRWESDDSPWSRALVRYLHVPALREMRWGTFNDLRSHNNDIRAFFNRLPPTLTTIVLEFRTSRLEYLRNDSNVEILVLRYCEARDIRTLFDKLTPGLHEGQGVKPLPRLKRIIICDKICEGHEDLDLLVPSYSDALVEMLEQRLDESNNSFSLETAETRFGWTPDARARMSELINKGYNVEIVEGVEEDLWL